MESRVAKAVEAHKNNHNCAQSILCTYGDLVGFDTDAAYRLAAGLGMGMGCTEGTCGSLNGACIMSGLKNSPGREVKGGNAPAMRQSREIVTRFKEAAGATKCAQLRGVEPVGTGDAPGEPLMVCDECIATSAKLVEDVLFPGQFE